MSDKFAVDVSLNRRMTEDEANKAYKKASLKLHPDKNRDKEEDERAVLEAMSRGWSCFRGLRFQGSAIQESPESAGCVVGDYLKNYSDLQFLTHMFV